MNDDFMNDNLLSQMYRQMLRLIEAEQLSPYFNRHRADENHIQSFLRRARTENAVERLRDILKKVA